MGAAAATDDIRSEHPTEAYQDLAAPFPDDSRREQRETPQPRRSSQGQNRNPVSDGIPRRLDAELAAKKMDLVPQISQAFRGSIEILFGSSL
jgi:hypothetical protein